MVPGLMGFIAHKNTLMPAEGLDKYPNRFYPWLIN